MTYNPQQFWNTRALAHRCEFDARGPEKGDDFFDNVFTKIEWRETDKVLEVGCGDGKIYRAFRDRGIPVDLICCDFAEEYRKKFFEYTGIMPDYWDGQTLPYEDNSFKMVISYNVLLHVPPEDFEQVWAEHIRVSQKYFFVSTFAPSRTRPEVQNLAEHCFANDYWAMIRKHNLHLIYEKAFEEHNSNWLFEVPDERTT